MNTEKDSLPTSTVSPSCVGSLAQLRGAMRASKSYAWTFHCNVACSIRDSINCSHEEANTAAARVMQNIFNVGTTSEPPTCEGQCTE